jgi:hypothetical protein
VPCPNAKQFFLKRTLLLPKTQDSRLKTYHSVLLRLRLNIPTTPNPTTTNDAASGTPVSAYPLNPVTVKLAYIPSYDKSLAANAVQLIKNAPLTASTSPNRLTVLNLLHNPATGIPETHG